ncbi:hypothetical protein GCM10020331_031530 [Ectobacillus funiculus]
MKNKMRINGSLTSVFFILRKNKKTLKEELFMARYTGPSWKLSRRLGISLSGTGKELEKNALTHQVHTAQVNVKIV